jgi:hypothetical protein
VKPDDYCSSGDSAAEAQPIPPDDLDQLGAWL